jgi:O-antigen ligase
VRLRDRVTAAAGALAAVFAVFALGSAPRWAQAIVAVVVAIALTPQIWSRSASERVSPLLILLGLSAALSALQLVPLPEGALELLQPTGHSLREDGAMLVGFAPSTSLSLDTPGTLRAVAFFVTLVGVAVVALRIAATERGRYRLLVLVGGICAATTVTVGVHYLFDIDDLYGLYTPRATPSLLAPLLNENHLGSLMALGTIVTLGLALYPRQRGWVRACWLLAVAACGVVTVSSHSRGATLALIVGFLVTIGILIGQRFTTSKPTRRSAQFITSSLPLGVVVACAVVLVIYWSAAGVERELTRTSLADLEKPTSKFTAWRSAMSLVGESPWVGVGRGAFETSFSRVHSASGQATFSHLENEYLQAVVDWGIPASVALAVAMLWLMITAIRRWRDGVLAAAALGSLSVIAVQSVFDFGIELLGLAVPVTILTAVLTYRPLQQASPKTLRQARTTRAILVVALVASACVLLAPCTTTLEEDRAGIGRSATPLETARDALARHPLDYYGYATVAQHLLRGGEQRGIRFLNHAMSLHPYHPGLHLMAARLLLRTGHPEQAASEYSLALQNMVEPQRVIPEIISTFEPQLAVKAIPPDTADLKYTVETLRKLDKPEIAIAWLARVVRFQRRASRACDLLYSFALRGSTSALEIATRSCPDLLPDPQTRFELARLMFQNNAHAKVLRLLDDVETWRGRIDRNTSAWLLRCEAHTALLQWDDAKRCLRRLDASGVANPERRADISSRIEQLDKRRATAEDGADAGSAN